MDNYNFLKKWTSDSYIVSINIKKNEPCVVKRKKTEKIWYSSRSIDEKRVKKELLKDRNRKKQKRLLRKRSILWRRPLINSDERLCGGACYWGESKEDASRILDSSQKGTSHPRGDTGHPRGHASNPRATGIEDSVKNYSMTKSKTGFLSRSDQDLVAHLVLINDECQDVMELLNEMGEKASRESIHIHAEHLNISDDKIPKVQEWYRGEKVGKPFKMKEVVAVLKHFYGKYDEEDADVFILTLYPKK